MVRGPDPSEFHPGDLVEVNGAVNDGQYAPMIAGATARKVGLAPIPRAKSTSVGELLTGGEEGQVVEIDGWVRSTWRIAPSLAGLNLVSGGRRISIRVSDSAEMKLDELVGAKVRARGVASAVRFRDIMRQMLEVRVFVASPADLLTEEREAAGQLSEPAVSLVEAFQFRVGSSPGRRVRVAGEVAVQTGNTIYITDGASGLEMRLAQPETVGVGERVEAVGFPDMKGFLPVLSDAILSSRGAKAAALQPRVVTSADLRSGLHHANYISIRARLINRLARSLPALDAAETATQPSLVLSMQDEYGVFEAELPSVPPETFLRKLEIGSLLEIDGICLLQPRADGTPAGFKILAPSMDRLRVLRPPPFFDLRRILIILCVCLAVLLLLASWAVVLARRNSALKAVNAERARLARDLHDSLEQALVGIGLQISSADHAAKTNLAKTRERLAVARELVKHSHHELRQSIWDLRHSAGEPFDLIQALRRAAETLAGDSGVRIEIEGPGKALPPLPALMEENLFRIAQEALTNAIKHARARKIAIHLRARHEILELEIADDGEGFPASNPERDGHFGLVGMRERAQRIGATLEIAAGAPHGAVVRVVVPLNGKPTP